KDVDFALDYIDEHARSRVEQEQVLNALRYKCDILWAMLDALHFAYVSPGWVPPGAFVPDA
ncbi:MAG: pyrroloquinoline-quinone synthase PqqC, partial [Janthinobacterium lividum]